MPAKDPRFYLIQIRECCDRILNYTAGIESAWPDVPVVYDAVCRNLEIIGEAARRFEGFPCRRPRVDRRRLPDS